MNISAGSVCVTATEDDKHLLASASIWARSTAIRDRAPQPVDVAVSLRGIRRRLGIDGSSLLIAQMGQRAVGFAVCAPQGRILEVFYLAVDPDVWGQRIAQRLLRGVDTHALALDYEVLELWVLDDNDRAISAYERAGWIRTDVVQRDDTSHRIERRLRRRLRIPPDATL